jgi:hypothetical protein
MADVVAIIFPRFEAASVGGLSSYRSLPSSVSSAFERGMRMIGSRLQPLMRELHHPARSAAALLLSLVVVGGALG